MVLSVMSAKVDLWLWSVNALIAFTLVFWAFGRGIGTTPYTLSRGSIDAPLFSTARHGVPYIYMSFLVTTFHDILRVLCSCDLWSSYHLSGSQSVHVRTTQPQTLTHLETSNNLYGETVCSFSRNWTSAGSSGGEGALVRPRRSCLVLALTSVVVFGHQPRTTECMAFSLPHIACRLVLLGTHFSAAPTRLPGVGISCNKSKSGEGSGRGGLQTHEGTR